MERTRRFGSTATLPAAVMKDIATGSPTCDAIGNLNGTSAITDAVNGDDNDDDDDLVPNVSTRSLQALLLLLLLRATRANRLIVPSARLFCGSQCAVIDLHKVYL